ncbi:hypothetical protein WQ54_04310 [Bacillus sp. SA1-12]|uniref:hypothetical protein n=1 Tax=Bacillus sp. SA1-12 TaxID=1455638 RepID=UPI000626921A|nr:hypothetical protein [Bacillus sp. SA1-12]KKI93466.1 hypothetical protein WQ54_04310 [Bacillus sp. SA1-12]
MIKVMIKTRRHVQFMIPVPYAVLNCLGALLSSQLLWKQIKKWTNQTKADPWIPDSLDKEMFNIIITSLKNHKGLTLVDAELQENMKVKIIL